MPEAHTYMKTKLELIDTSQILVNETRKARQQEKHRHGYWYLGEVTENTDTKTHGDINLIFRF